LRNDSCSGTFVQCISGPYSCSTGKIIRSDFIIGETYYIRIYTYDANPSSVEGTLWVSEITPASNSLCENAVDFTPSIECYDNFSGNLYEGGESANPAISCSSGTNVSLWMKFEASSETHYIKTIYTEGSGDYALQALTGPDCNNLTEVACADQYSDSSPENLLLTGLTIGQTIYIRVYCHDYMHSDTYFELCVQTPPPNDQYDDAILITTTTGVTCNDPTSGTTWNKISSEHIPPTIDEGEAGLSDDSFGANDKCFCFDTY